MPSDFDITRYLPYLVNRVGVRLATAFSDAIRHHDITLQMWRVLAALDHEDAQRIGALADATSIDVSTLSRLVGAMERKGLVVRRRGNGGDARVVTVETTARARDITASLIPLAQEYEQVALSDLSAEEIAALKDMLVRIYENTEALEGLAEEDADAA
ncbi:MAG: MarR family transcriptional regulator [Bauldia litoralis]